ncbi:MAG: undecaprenyl/decaprenyl-phosphate alpha-N-acetylglucosaminyl 1-phosphate transferase [Acidobacteria bacterium]|nr:undecaprenyl/decaprenyl-phosphate alpha-N-acetylglucosaminyl 1-phosphate transferase [Acidobacteriota bacterium]MBI3656386.1 undecaprenyl/decaprenyl-phosphate alpha-N-acetylglucosaminyl 1-phosphate transferase [Acidobacteriota bacterium]
MKTYLMLFFLSASVSLLLTPILLRISHRYQWLDVPDGRRKIHAQPVPRLGGIAIFMAFLVTLWISFLGHNTIFAALRGQWDKVVCLLLPATLIFLIGLFDDFRGVSAKTKLSLQLLAAGLLYYNGFRIEQIANPFGGSHWSLGWLSLPITLVWLVGVTNAFNLIDGMDGLAAGIAFFVSMASFFVSVAQFKPMVSVLSIIMAGATLGFLRYNFNPARIFMGDSGSYFIGFVVGALAIQGSQKSPVAVSIAVPLLLLGLPILDTMIAIARRFLEGAPIFNPDREHIHHRLMRIAHSQRFAVIILYGATAFLGLSSWLMVIMHSQLAAVISLTAGLAAFWGVKSLQYEEFQELGRYLSGLFTHRHALVHQIYLRKLSDRIAASASLGDVLLLVAEALGRLNFDVGEICLARARSSSANHVYLPLEQIYRWSWAPTGEPAALKLPVMWELNIPLEDGRGAGGYFRLARSIEKEPLPKQLTAMVQLLTHKLQAVADSSGEDELSSLFKPVSASLAKEKQMAAGVHRG